MQPDMHPIVPLFEEVLAHDQWQPKGSSLDWQATCYSIDQQT
jgi:hypothetical protein